MNKKKQRELKEKQRLLNQVIDKVSKVFPDAEVVLICKKEKNNGR